MHSYGACIYKLATFFQRSLYKSGSMARYSGTPCIWISKWKICFPYQVGFSISVYKKIGKLFRTASMQSDKLMSPFAASNATKVCFISNLAPLNFENRSRTEQLVQINKESALKRYNCMNSCS